jgi:serine phosphatase RsbU (regulator of sigma subunit)
MDKFYLFLPKDIVSGDFFWSQKIENKILVGVFDCTGHGVPGAFMSMLGVHFIK